MQAEDSLLLEGAVYVGVALGLTTLYNAKLVAEFRDKWTSETTREAKHEELRRAQRWMFMENVLWPVSLPIRLSFELGDVLSERFRKTKDAKDD